MDEKTNAYEMVDHPKHYSSHPSGIEAIEIVRYENFNRGCVIKYVLRAGRKPGVSAVQDLEKALWYLKDEIARLKEEVWAEEKSDVG